MQFNLHRIHVMWTRAAETLSQVASSGHKQMAELAKQRTYSNRIWDRIALPAPGTELKVNLNQPTAICQETERKETVITKIFVVISSYICILLNRHWNFGRVDACIHWFISPFQDCIRYGIKLVSAGLAFWFWGLDLEEALIVPTRSSTKIDFEGWIWICADNS